MEPLLLRSEITKRTRPCPEVSAESAGKGAGRAVF